MGRLGARNSTELQSNLVPARHKGCCEMQQDLPPAGVGICGDEYVRVAELGGSVPLPVTDQSFFPPANHCDGVPPSRPTRVALKGEGSNGRGSASSSLLDGGSSFAAFRAPAARCMPLRNDHSAPLPSYESCEGCCCGWCSRRKSHHGRSIAWPLGKTGSHAPVGLLAARRKAATSAFLHPYLHILMAP
jgi:hypothetical protein